MSKIMKLEDYELVPLWKVTAFASEQITMNSQAPYPLLTTLELIDDDWITLEPIGYMLKPKNGEKQ